MVTVVRSGPIAAVAASPVQRPGSSGFAVLDQTASPGAPVSVGKSGAAGAISSAMMLTLQESGSREQADEEARRHGWALLEELTGLQRALLDGSDSGSLERLEALSRIGPEDVDPALAGVVSSIRLRARIELARRKQGRDAV